MVGYIESARSFGVLLEGHVLAEYALTAACQIIKEDDGDNGGY